MFVVVVVGTSRNDTATPTTGLPELSSTRPDKLVGAPGTAPVTVRAMVSDDETDPSEATNTRVNVPTCVASGVKLNTPVRPLNVICAGNVGDAGAACSALYVTGCPFGSTPDTVKASVLPNDSVLFPMGERTGALLRRVNGSGLVAVPRGVVTVTAPVRAPTGTAVVSELPVVLTERTVARTPPNRT